MKKDNNYTDLFENILELSDLNSVFKVMSRWEYLLLGKFINISNDDGDGKIYLENIKHELNIPMPKVSEIVQTMSDDGFVLWDLDAENKKTYIQVTAGGREKWNLQREGMEKIRHRLEKELTKEEKEKFYSASQKVLNILSEEKKKTEAYFDIIMGKTTDKMNIIGLLKPKDTTYYIYDNYSFRKTVEILKKSGFTTIPVIDIDGKYLGTVSEGDIFWYLHENRITSNLDKVYISNIINKKRNPPVSDTSDSATIINNIMKQNFLCMVDSRNCFIGIITRKDIIKYLRKKSDNQ